MSREAKLWTVAEVGHWLKSIDCESLIETFEGNPPLKSICSPVSFLCAENQIEGRDLFDIDQADLQTEFHIKSFRLRKQLWRELCRLRGLDIVSSVSIAAEERSSCASTPSLVDHQSINAPSDESIITTSNSVSPAENVTRRVFYPSGRRITSRKDRIALEDWQIRSIFPSRALPEDELTVRPSIEAPDGSINLRFNSQYHWSFKSSISRRRHFAARLMKSSLIHTSAALDSELHFALSEKYLFFVWCPHPEAVSPVALRILQLHHELRTIVLCSDTDGSLMAKLRMQTPTLTDPYGRFLMKTEDKEQTQERIFRYLTMDADHVIGEESDQDELTEDDSLDDEVDKLLRKKPVAESLAKSIESKSTNSSIISPSPPDTPKQKSDVDGGPDSRMDVGLENSASIDPLTHDDMPMDTSPELSCSRAVLVEAKSPLLGSTGDDFSAPENTDESPVPARPRLLSVCSKPLKVESKSVSNDTSSSESMDMSPELMIVRPKLLSVGSKAPLAPNINVEPNSLVQKTPDRPKLLSLGMKSTASLVQSPSSVLPNVGSKRPRSVVDEAGAKKLIYDVASQVVFLDDDDNEDFDMRPLSAKKRKTDEPSSTFKYPTHMSGGNNDEKKPNLLKRLIEEEDLFDSESSSSVHEVKLDSPDSDEKKTPKCKRTSVGKLRRELLSAENEEENKTPTVRRLLSLAKKNNKKKMVSSSDDTEMEMNGAVGSNPLLAPPDDEPPAAVKVLVNQQSQARRHPVYLPHFLASQLKIHQIDGVRFMWKVIFKEVKRESERHGCVLAHSMGLGKTLQVITFIHTCLVAFYNRHSYIPKHFHDKSGDNKKSLRVLVLCPTTCVDNWHIEWRRWIPPAHQWCYGSGIHKFSSNCSATHRNRVLMDWFQRGGVIIMGYERYRDMLCGRKNSNNSTEDFETQKQYLQSPGPHIVVCDEAHRIKNPRSQLSIVLKQINTPTRICLTGSPLQNNVEEYWCMVDFVNPNFLGSIADFKVRYANPILDGMMADATAPQKRASVKKLYVLQKILDPFVFRLDINQEMTKIRTRAKQSCEGLMPSEKREYTIKCRLTDVQFDIYMRFLRFHGFLDQKNKTDTPSFRIFERMHELLLVVNHPDILLEKAKELQQQNAKKKTESMSSDELGNNSSANPISLLEDSDGICETDEQAPIPPLIIGHGINVKEDDPTEGGTKTESTDDQSQALYSEISTILQSEDYIKNAEKSFKLSVLIRILRMAKKMGDKTLVFSRSIPTLDLLETKLKSLNIMYRRLDGKVPVHERQARIDEFNNDENIDVFLISVMVGGLGVNCQSANRVVLFDAGWNPSNDEQAVARSHRYGQSKSVYVYRLYGYSTIEDTLYKLNLKKLALSKLVIDQKQTNATFTKKELCKYFAPPLQHVDPRINMTFDFGDSIIDSLREQFQWEIVEILDHCVLLEEFDPQLSEQEIAEATQNLEEELKRVQMNKESPMSVPTEKQPIIDEVPEPENEQEIIDDDDEGEDDEIVPLRIKPDEKKLFKRDSSVSPKGTTLPTIENLVNRSPSPPPKEPNEHPLTALDASLNAILELNSSGTSSEKSSPIQASSKQPNAIPQCNQQ